MTINSQERVPHGAIFTPGIVLFNDEHLRSGIEDFGENARELVGKTAVLLTRPGLPLKVHKELKERGRFDCVLFAPVTADNPEEKTEQILGGLVTIAKTLDLAPWRFIVAGTRMVEMTAAIRGEFGHREMFRDRATQGAGQDGILHETIRYIETTRKQVFMSRGKI